MGGCGRGVAHQTCLTVMAREPGSRSLCVYVLEAPSSELAHAICTHIGKEVLHMILNNIDFYDTINLEIFVVKIFS